jgi:uridine kinase
LRSLVWTVFIKVENPHIKGIDKNVVDVAEYNFDHPLALDFDAAYEVLKVLKYTNDPVPVPQYSFVEHQRLPDPVFVKPANIILFEGLMVFHDERIRNMMTYKIFINCDGNSPLN